MFDPQAKSSNNWRLLLAVGLSGLVLLVSDLGMQYVYGRHIMGAPVPQAVPATPVKTIPTGMAGQGPTVSVSTSLASVRIPLENERVKGQIALTGGRLDALVLKQYKKEITEPNGFELFKPSGAFAEYIAAGWQGNGLETPGESSIWQLEADQTTTNRVVMVWRNGTGQAFQRTYTLVPDSYVWEVTERMVNSASLPVTLTPYVQVHREGGYWPHERSNWVNYFGPMGQITNGEGSILHEVSYATLQKQGKSDIWQGEGGWWGITSQYFAALVVPGQEMPTTRQFTQHKVGDANYYTASVQFAPQTVAVGGNTEITYRIYAGPKHYSQLKAVGAGLEQTIAWGWFEPIVKGLYYVLALIHSYVPNWGLSVILITVLLKIVTYPLANTSYRAMAKMKKLQPEIEAMRKRHDGNQTKIAEEMMALYKKAKVNPLSGCWPMLIQIPIFFAMYKVVLVMFEFRHAPFYGWITDLSTYDPWFVLPILMGISMWVQFKLNPKPTDPMQEVMFRWMPLLMTVMFLWFPAGLVLYWFTNNVLSIGQQYLMMRKEHAI
jgi:YidC/Oxa1 family membrane protein insertase